MLERVVANWPLKLLAVGVAFAIWVAVTGENRILQDFQVPVDLRLGPGVMLATNAPTVVTVRLRGPESLVRRLDPVPLGLRLDLSNAHPGDQDLSLTETDLRGIPRGVEVDFIVPDRIRVKLERRLRRELEIEPTFLGRPAPGFTLYDSGVEPALVSVEGPESSVTSLGVLHTSPIELDGRAASFVASVGVVLDQPLVRRIDTRPLQVRVDIDQTAVERTFPRLPVRVLGAEGVSALPATLDLKISGPPRLLERLAPEQIQLVADASGRPRGTGASTVDVEVRFANISPGDRAKLQVRALSRHRVALRDAAPREDS